jgi:hypothetical protein
MNEVTFPHVAIYNDPSSGEQDADVQAMVAALQRQVDNDFGPAWHTGAHVDFVASAVGDPGDCPWCPTPPSSRSRHDHADAVRARGVVDRGPPLRARRSCRRRLFCTGHPDRIGMYGRERTGSNDESSKAR